MNFVLNLWGAGIEADSPQADFFWGRGLVAESPIAPQADNVDKVLSFVDR